MSMKSWAINEVELFKKSNSTDEDLGYVNSCADSALKAYQSLMEDGHSGMSFKITASLLISLMDEKPLTPLEDTGWNLVSDSNGVRTFQHNRRSSLFKDVKGASVTFSDINLYAARDIDNERSGYSTGLITKMVNEMYPVKFPYTPPKKRIQVYTETLLCCSDKKYTDFDTKAILYLIDANGYKVEINKYYKEGEEDWIEIDAKEYQSIKVEKL